MARCHRTPLIVRCGVLAVLLATQLPAVPAVAASDTSKLHRVPTDRMVPNSFIVVLKNKPGMNPAAVAPDLVRRHGGTVRKTYRRTLLGYAATMTADQAQRVAEDPDVAYVEPDQATPAAPSDVPRTKAQSVPWGLDRIDERDLPLDGAYKYKQDGKGVTAYIVDSGIRSSHHLISSAVLSGHNATGDGNGTKDCWGRGTGVAGVVGAQDYGVARAVKVVPVRVGGCGATTTTASVIAAAEWLTTNSVRPAVVSMSAGQGLDSDAVNTAITNSIANGLPWVIAIGDGNTDGCATSPGGIAEAITVAATDQRDARWVTPGRPDSGSNYGGCVDLFAPGRDITTLARSSDTGTIDWSGTSFAAAHATGVAAMYLSDHPHATPTEVANRLLRTATPKDVKGAGGSPGRLLYIASGS